MALVVNRSHNREFFFPAGGFVKYKCSSVVSNKRRAQNTDHRGLYLLRTRYYSKLAAGV